MLHTYERRVLGKKPIPFGWAARLSRFEIEATEREWQQLTFYMEMATRLCDIPGDVAEFGVAGGVSFLAFARTLRVMERGYDKKERRRLYGFDSFEGLPELSELDTATHAGDRHMTKGGFDTPHAYDALFSFVEREPNCSLFTGWFDDTLPQFMADNPHVSFALVHIDCDLYESTKTVLDLVWDHVTPGGIVLFDELFHKDYPGETIAYREFFADKQGHYVMRRSTVKPDKKYILKIPAS